MPNTDRLASSSVMSFRGGGIDAFLLGQLLALGRAIPFAYVYTLLLKFGAIRIEVTLLSNRLIGHKKGLSRAMPSLTGNRSSLCVSARSRIPLNAGNVCEPDQSRPVKPFDS